MKKKANKCRKLFAMILSLSILITNLNFTYAQENLEISKMTTIINDSETLLEPVDIEEINDQEEVVKEQTETSDSNISDTSDSDMSKIWDSDYVQQEDSIISNPSIATFTTKDIGSWTPYSFYGSGTEFFKDYVNVFRTSDKDAYSFKIVNNNYNDSRLLNTFSVAPNTYYRISAKVKTENVINHPDDSGSIGANISIDKNWTRPDTITGTHDWTELSLTHFSGNSTTMTVALRNGFYSSLTKGTVWFDDVKVEQIDMRAPNEWNFMVLVFNKLDATVIRDGRSVRYQGSLTSSAVNSIKQRVNYIKNDFPEISGGLMKVNSVDIYEIDTPIDKIAPYGNGYHVTGDNINQTIDYYSSLKKYDHIICVGPFNSIADGWYGLGGTYYKDMGFTCVNLNNATDPSNEDFPAAVFIHEFLHSLETRSRQLGITDFPVLHEAGDYGYSSNTGGREEWYQWYVDYMRGLVMRKDGSGIFGLNPVVYNVSKGDSVISTDMTSNISEIRKLNGSGTDSDPYLVSTVSELRLLNKNLTASYKLTANIDLENNDWEPIGTKPAPFKGKLDGNGYVISNLNVDKPAMDYVGLFSYSDAATFNNVQIENANVLGLSYVGGLIGNAKKSTIENCSVVGSGSIKGDSVVGGLVGFKEYGVISGSNAKINVIGTIESVGGLIGDNAGEVDTSYASGTVSGPINVGGLIGYARGEGLISQTYSTSNVEGTGKADRLGGLIGRIGSDKVKVDNSYALGNVKGLGECGGLVGYSSVTTMTNCYFAGKVSGGKIGGITPSLSLVVVNSYFDSQTTGLSTPTTQARTTAQLKLKKTFVNWDFTNKWVINESAFYPCLKV